MRGIVRIPDGLPVSGAGVSDQSRALTRRAGRAYARPARIREPTRMPRHVEKLERRSRCYPFDAPSRREIEELRASDPLLGRVAALDRKVSIHFRWTTGIQLFTLAVIAVLVNR